MWRKRKSNRVMTSFKIHLTTIINSKGRRKHYVLISKISLATNQINIWQNEYNLELCKALALHETEFPTQYVCRVIREPEFHMHN